MCGRYKRSTDKDKLIRRFRVERVETDLFGPRYNIAPSHESLVVVLEDGKRVMRAYRWGLVPSWAKGPEPGPINARAETLSQKPMFRNMLKGKRCLVPSDGFYEWKRLTGAKRKQPYLVTRKDGEPFAFAGLWDLWKGPDGKDLRTYAIVTTEPNAVVAAIHDRMPVILATPEDEERWLAGEASDAAQALKPLPEGEVTAHPVSTLVNSPAMDSPECARTASEV